MPHWFLRFSEFTEFNESSGPFRENSDVYLSDFSDSLNSLNSMKVLYHLEKLQWLSQWRQHINCKRFTLSQMINWLIGTCFCLGRIAFKWVTCVKSPSQTQLIISLSKIYDQQSDESFVLHSFKTSTGDSGLNQQWRLFVVEQVSKLF